MNLLRASFLLPGCMAIAMLVGCGGSSRSGAINVHLVDGPISGFQEVNVNIQRVEISQAGNGWITLGTPNKTINLLSLTGGVEELLVSGASLSEGQYQQMRLVLGSGNTLKLGDGSVVSLTVPSGLQTGIKLIVSFEVQAGTTKDVFIDFDAAHSIQVVKAGASDKYILRPTVWAYDKVVTGSVSGTFTDGGGQPLVGALVYAETLDGSGNPRITRSTLTDATGKYTLDLLPVGSTYYVVSQPILGTLSYDAKASDPKVLTTSSSIFTYNASYTLNSQVGTISGTVTPTATSDQADTVNLFQSLSSGGNWHTFILRSQMAVVGTSETYSFANVPAGGYSVGGTRTTLASDGSTTSASTALKAATVTNGITSTVDLAF